MTSQAIGFIGLGNMGLPMARRLIEAGHRLSVYNRSPERAALLLETGAKLARTPREAVEPGGVVITMVADDRALDQVTLGADGVLGALGAGGVHLSMSTVAVDTAKRMDALHAERGASYLCAPVFGRPPAAAAGKLWIALSGAEAAKRRVLPLLAPLSQGVKDFGDVPGAANVVKLAGNFMIAAAIESIAEACALAEKSGIDRRALVELMAGSLFDCPVYRLYGEGVALRRYQPAAFRSVLGLKDISLVLAAAAQAQTPMPFASLLRDRLLGLVAKGHGDLDWTAIDRAVSEDAGLAPGA